MTIYHILDTETASLQGGVVELAYLLVDDQLEIIKEFCERVNPERPIEPGAQAIHGITDDEVKDCRTLAQIAESEQLDQISLIGHNAAFDRRIIESSISVKRTLCSLALARIYVKGTTNHKLQTLKAELPLPEQESHTALGDVHTVRDLLKHVLAVSEVSLETLFERQDKPRILTIMPWGKHKGTVMLKVPREYRNWLLEQPDLDRDLKLTLEKLKNL